MKKILTPLALFTFLSSYLIVLAYSAFGSEPVKNDSQNVTNVNSDQSVRNSPVSQYSNTNLIGIVKATDKPVLFPGNTLEIVKPVVCFEKEVPVTNLAPKVPSWMESSNARPYRSERTKVCYEQLP